MDSPEAFCRQEIGKQYGRAALLATDSGSRQFEVLTGARINAPQEQLYLNGLSFTSDAGPPHWTQSRIPAIISQLSHLFTDVQSFAFLGH